MTILVDHQVRDLAINFDMISPFYEGLVEEGVISYGLSSFGYDIRVGDKFYIFHNLNTTTVDPKSAQKDEYFVMHGGPSILIPPNSFALAHSLEYIKMPRWVTGLMTTKSSYARCGISSPPTVLEAGWEGQITIEIINNTPLPARIYSNEGIAQILFFAGASPDVDYGQRKGKYQNQTGITLPRIK